MTDLTGTRLGGDLNLGRGPRLGRDQSPEIGQRLDCDLSLGGSPRPGRCQFRKRFKARWRS